MRTSLLKIARIKKGLTQGELADLVGVTRQTIVAIESDAYNPTLKLCVRICLELGETLDSLFWNEDFLKNN